MFAQMESASAQGSSGQMDLGGGQLLVGGQLHVVGDHHLQAFRLGLFLSNSNLIVGI